MGISVNPTNGEFFHDADRLAHFCVVGLGHAMSHSRLRGPALQPQLVGLPAWARGLKRQWITAFGARLAAHLTLDAFVLDPILEICRSCKLDSVSVPRGGPAQRNPPLAELPVARIWQSIEDPHRRHALAARIIGAISKRNALTCFRILSLGDVD